LRRRQPVAFDGDELAGIVAYEAHGADAEVSQDLHADAVVSLVGFEPKAFIGLYGVESFVLQAVGANLVGQANPSSFLVQVKQHSTTFRRDPAQGFIELSTTVATSGTQNITGKAL